METERAVRVYVANYAGHDYQRAEDFGKLCFVTRGFVPFDNLDRLKFEIAQALADSHENDFLLLSGTSLVNVFAALLWYIMHNKVRLLIYNRETGYKEIVISHASIEKMLEVIRG